MDCMEHLWFWGFFFVGPEVELWWILTSQSLPTWDILWFYVHVFSLLPYPFPPKYFLWQFSWKKSFDIHSFWYFSVFMESHDPQYSSEVYCESLEGLESLILIFRNKSVGFCFFFNQTTLQQKGDFASWMIDFWDCTCIIRQSHYFEQCQAKK